MNPKSILGCLVALICLMEVHYTDSKTEKSLKPSLVDSQEQQDEFDYDDYYDDDNDLQKLFKKFFKKVIIVIKSKDPLNYPGIEFNQNSYGLKCQGYLKNLSISSFSSIELTQLKVTENPVHFELGLGFTLLQVLGVYDLDFDFLTMLPVFGKGDLGAAISNINVSIALDIAKEDDAEIMQLKTVNLNLTVQSLKVDIKNILDNPAMGAYVSNIISDVSPYVLGTLGKLVKSVEGRVKQFVNNYLIENGVTLEKIIEMIKQFVH